MTVLSLARPVRQQLLHLKSSVSSTRRWLAEAAVLTPEPSNPKQAITTMGPVDWRKHKVPVREDHGLWAFFRRRQLEDGKELTGEAKYMACESPTTRMADSGMCLSRILNFFNDDQTGRTWMESRGITFKELQGHAHAVVCSPPRT